MGSDSDLPTMKAAEDILQEFGVPCELTIVSAHRTPDRMMTYARTAHERGLQVGPVPLLLPSLLVTLGPTVALLLPTHMAELDSTGRFALMPSMAPVGWGSNSSSPQKYCCKRHARPPFVDWRCVLRAASCLQVIIAGAGGAAHLPGMVAAMTPLPVIGVPVKPAGAYLDGVDALLSIVQMPKGVPVATVAIGNAANAGLLAVRVLAGTDGALLQKMLEYQDGMRDMVLGKAAKVEAERA